MKTRLILCVVSLCVFLFGCEQAKINDLIKVVSENPEKYFETYTDYDELKYVSAEYDSEKDSYFVLYQGKHRIHDEITTTNLNAQFFYSEGEWVFHDVEIENVNTYLDIAGTYWETKPRQSRKNIGEPIHILDVAEDNSEISLKYGEETIKFVNLDDSKMGTDYISTDRNEVIVMRYMTYSSDALYGERVQLLLYLDYKESSGYVTPDLNYSLVK